MWLGLAPVSKVGCWGRIWSEVDGPEQPRPSWLWARGARARSTGDTRGSDREAEVWHLGSVEARPPQPFLVALVK
jgi:hypothetical protein